MKILPGGVSNYPIYIKILNLSFWNFLLFFFPQNNINILILMININIYILKIIFSIKKLIIILSIFYILS